MWYAIGGSSDLRNVNPASWKVTTDNVSESMKGSDKTFSISYSNVSI